MGDIEVVVEEGQGTKGHVELGDDLGDGTDDEGVGKQAGFAAVEIGKEESAGDDIEHERYYVVGSRDNGIGKLRLGQRRSGGAKVNNAVGDGAKDQTEHEHESNIAAEFGRFIGGALQQEYADAGDDLRLIPQSAENHLLSATNAQVPLGQWALGTQEVSIDLAKPRPAVALSGHLETGLAATTFRLNYAF